MTLFFCLREDILCAVNRQSVSATCFLSLCCYPVPEDNCTFALHLPFILPARPYRLGVGRYPSYQFFSVRRSVYEYLAEEIQALKDRHGYAHGVLMFFIIFLFNSHIPRYRHGKIIHGKGSPHGLADGVVLLTVEVKDSNIVFQDAKTGLYNFLHTMY